MAKNKINVEDIESAINQYLETNSLAVFNKFTGKCKGCEPYGEKDLGDAINSGDLNHIAKIVGDLSNFTDTSEETEWDADAKAIDKKKEELDDTTNKKKYYETLKKVADKHNGLHGLGGSKLAEADRELYKEKEKELGKEKSREKDKKYLDEKKKAIEDFKSTLENNKTNANEQEASITSEPVNASEHYNGDDKMEISRKDLTKIMSAMKTINKHFAEDDAEDGVVESQVETTDEDSEVEDKTEEAKVETIELPEDVADAIREALDESKLDEDEEKDESESEEEDFSEDDYAADVDEDGDTEEDFCGETEDFSEDADVESFYKFSEAITETIENLNKKVSKLSGKAMDDANAYIENFSEVDFRNFAEAVTDTLANISARVDMLNAKVTNKDEVTTNIDSLEQTADNYEKEFITKSDEPSSVESNVLVQNNDASVVANAQFSETNGMDHYNKVKNFLGL